MKQGRYFKLPEGPADVEQLWHEAHPVGAAPRPAWMHAQETSYRYLGATPCSPRGDSDQKHYAAELGELEMCGAFAEPDPQSPGVGHLYLRAPNRAIFSIGIYNGSVPWRLRPHNGVANPVLRREDVSDVVATFVADPFMVRRDRIWYMFFEVMNWRTGKGEIALATSEDGLDWRYQQVVLSKPDHLSYPYVFEWEGCYYMIPEGFKAGEVRLYRAERFPLAWSCVDSLLQGPYFVDPSLLRYQGRWWLFTETNPSVQHDTLRLYGAIHLTGPWIEHPSSPVVRANASLARPAGRIVCVGSTLVRFAQNCATAYGVHVRAIQITELTEVGYRERQLTDEPVLAPTGHGWNAHGMHHVDPRRQDGQWIACVDGWYDGI